MLAETGKPAVGKGFGRVTAGVRCDHNLVARSLQLWVLFACFSRCHGREVGAGCNETGIAGNAATSLRRLRDSHEYNHGPLMSQTQGTNCLRQKNTIPAGLILGKPIQTATFEGCCDKCRSHRANNTNGCNVFAYCGNPDGCWHPSYVQRFVVMDCLLFYQQSLDVGGQTMESEDFDVLEVIEFDAGIPVQFEPTPTVTLYDMFAYGTLTDMADFPCNGSHTVGKCQKVNVTAEEAASFCAGMSNSCYGYEWLPFGNLTTNSSIVTLKGGADLSGFLQYLLTINAYMLPSPSAGLFVQKRKQPTARDFMFTFWLVPKVNIMDSVNNKSGCIVEYNTLYQGDTIATLDNIASAVQCCQACEENPSCNSYLYCPYPTGCEKPGVGEDEKLYEWGTCFLQSQVPIANGQYPAIFAQDATIWWSSGVPPKFAKVIAANLPNIGTRPNEREEGSSGRLSRDHTLFTGLRINDGNDNLQPSFEACCDSCRNTEPCNTFEYCPEPEGCVHYYKNVTYRQGACRLLWYGPMGMNSAPSKFIGEGTELALYGRGDLIKFQSGTPIRVANTTVTGYTLYDYASLQGIGDFDCGIELNRSWLAHPVCRVDAGSAKDAALACKETKGCEAFAWVPFGDGLDDVKTSVAYLKTGGDNDMMELVQNRTPNPSVGLYVANHLLGIATPVEETATGGSGSGNLGLILGISVGVSTCVGIVVLLCVAAFKLRHRSNASDNGVLSLSAALKEASRSENRLKGWRGALPWTKHRLQSRMTSLEINQTVITKFCSDDSLSHMFPTSIGNLSQDCCTVSDQSDNLMAAIAAHTPGRGDPSNGMPNESTQNALTLLTVSSEKSQPMTGIPKAAAPPLSHATSEKNQSSKIGSETAGEQLERQPPDSARSVFSNASSSPFQCFEPDAGPETGASLDSGPVDDCMVASGTSQPCDKIAALATNGALGLPQRKESQNSSQCSTSAVPAVGLVIKEMDLQSLPSNEVGSSYGWEVQPSELQICKTSNDKDWVLGRGAFGTVYKATFHGGMFVAVKELMTPQDHDGQDVSTAILKEISILKSVRSPNIVQFMGACQLADRFLLVTEFMEGGTLWRALQKKEVSWRNRGHSIALDSAEGLHFLHARKVLHMDFKSANVLLDRYCRAKVCDVGVAHVLQSSYAVSLDVKGTFAWMAPEVLLGGRVSTKADVYSFGVVLWEIVTGEEPHRGCMRPVNVPEDCPAVVRDLIEACLEAVPTKRPTMDNVIACLRQAAPGR